MKKLIGLFIAAGIANIGCFTIGCLAGKVEHYSADMFTNNIVQYLIESSVITNTISEEEYNTQTNSYTWTRRENVNILLDRNIYDSTITNTSEGTWTIANQSCVNAPDPFKAKVTVTYYAQVAQDTYYINIGDLREKYATKYTVLKRWKTSHTQKINMEEKTETKVE